MLVVAYQQQTPAKGERVVARMPLAWMHSAPTATLTTLHGGPPGIAARRGTSRSTTGRTRVPECA